MKVILWMAISLNGIIATKDNSEDFLSHDNWLEFVKAVKRVGCLIWGRKTYELVRKWDKSYLEPFKDITKIILSHEKNLSLDEGFTLANTPQQALEILKNNGFDNVILTGGSTNNSSFAKLRLIDEVYLDIDEVIVGQGIPLFKPEEFLLKLKLESTKTINNKIIQAHYLVEK